MIDRERLLGTFLTLAGFDAESFGERDTADYLKKRLDGLGIAAEEDCADEICGRKSPRSAGNVYGLLPGNADVEPVLLSSHMDTVKPGSARNRLSVRTEGSPRTGRPYSERMTPPVSPRSWKR